MATVSHSTIPKRLQQVHRLLFNTHPLRSSIHRRGDGYRFKEYDWTAIKAKNEVQIAPAALLCVTIPLPSFAGYREDSIPLQCYSANVIQFNKQPVVAWKNTPAGTADFAQVYNPSWVVASAGTGGKSGLLLRTQNCTEQCGQNVTSCCLCDAKVHPSYLTFAELLNNDNGTDAPSFARVTKKSIVFGPYNNSTAMGTEDPRVVYDNESGYYYLFYTCYGYDSNGGTSADLCEASTKTPLDASGWNVVGNLGFGSGSKSAALLIQHSKGTHYLYWGAGQIRLAKSTDLLSWNGSTSDPAFINGTLWGNRFVEAGPPPMKLSTGDYVLFHNSWPSTWKPSGAYEPAWVILDGHDPTKIIARAPVPLWSPSLEPWMRGDAPYYCNAPNVAFIEAAHPTNRPDEFRVYFGGADMVTGSAVVRVRQERGVRCNGTMPNIIYN